MPSLEDQARPELPFLCTYMGRAANGRKPFRFLPKKSQASAHNVYLLLYQLLGFHLEQATAVHAAVGLVLSRQEASLVVFDGAGPEEIRMSRYPAPSMAPPFFPYQSSIVLTFSTTSCTVSRVWLNVFLLNPSPYITASIWI